MFNSLNKKIINKFIYLISSRSQLKLLSFIGLPDKVARSLIKNFRIFININEFLYRKYLARKILKCYSANFLIHDSLGCCKFDIKSLSNAERLLAVSNKIIIKNKFQQGLKSDFYKGGKKFFNDLLSPEDLEENPIFIDFATDHNLLASITKYFGIFPI